MPGGKFNPRRAPPGQAAVRRKCLIWKFMKKNLCLCLIGIAAVLITAAYIFYSTAGGLTEAISAVKASYPEFKDYPSDNLPPRSIRAEKAANGWHIAFVQEGSGVPIIGAACFFVKGDKTVQYIGDFKPSSWEDSDFSIRTCD